MLLTLLQAIILGIIQGATEFIPISSSAHLILVPWLAGWTNPALSSLSFDVSLHLGTLIAVLWYFAADWVRLIRAGIASIFERRTKKFARLEFLRFRATLCDDGLVAGLFLALFPPAVWMRETYGCGAHRLPFTYVRRLAGLAGRSEP